MNGKVPWAYWMPHYCWVGMSFLSIVRMRISPLIPRTLVFFFSWNISTSSSFTLKHPDSEKFSWCCLKLEGKMFHVNSADISWNNCFGKMTQKLMKACQLFLMSEKPLRDKATSVFPWLTVKPEVTLKKDYSDWIIYLWVWVCK